MYATWRIDMFYWPSLLSLHPKKFVREGEWRAVLSDGVVVFDWEREPCSVGARGKIREKVSYINMLVVWAERFSRYV